MGEANMEEKNESKEKQYRLLAVDDEKDFLDIMKKMLERSDEIDCEVDTEDNGESALVSIGENEYDLIIADQKMPGLTGNELLTRIKKDHPDIIRILITGYPNNEAMKKAINEAEVHHYLEKPIEEAELIATVKRELDRKYERENLSMIKVADLMDTERVFNDFRESFSSISKDSPGIISVPESPGNRQKLIFEFLTQSNFNKFSYELKENQDLKEIYQARIDDVQVFNNRYFVTVSVKV